MKSEKGCKNNKRYIIKINNMFLSLFFKGNQNKNMVIAATCVLCFLFSWFLLQMNISEQEQS
jgi:hypothetical protein